jgi:ubiquinone/menaquinone biosynthesis C-methylase UbiE
LGFLAVGFAAAILAVVAVTPNSMAQSSPQPNPQGLASLTLIKRVPYVPTPQDVVEKMLDLAKVKPDDVVYDLGSGDGRIVITAAQKYGAQAVGIEINPDLYRQSRDRISQLNLNGHARVMCEDMYEVNLHRATVVTMYLLTSTNEKLRPKLDRELRPGTRIVCHDFHIPGWEPTEVVDVTSKNDIPHKLYLYVHP